ncbi:MAG: hypothetical protein ACREP8_16520, partial [Candidatus Binatia bacterium]
YFPVEALMGGLGAGQRRPEDELLEGLKHFSKPLSHPPGPVKHKVPDPLTEKPSKSIMLNDF